MGDGRAKRSRFGALRIDMNPLVVARGLGKLVDPFLGDFDPVAHSDFLAHACGHFSKRFKGFHRRSL